MLEQGGGRVINISSVEGRMGNKAAVSHYISAKHAMNGFTKAVAFEYGQQGITSNAICPGAVETERTKEIRSEEHTSELQSLMRNSYDVFCLTKKNWTRICDRHHTTTKK